MHEAYKRARNEVNKLVKNTKTKYFMNALSENNQNPKTMWNTIRTLTNKNSKTTNITEIHVENDHSVTEPKQIADAFNTFFNNIGTQLADALPVTMNITPESFITPANSSFEIHTVSIEKVFNLLCNRTR